MRRREFITLIGGATAAWPLAARAQQMPVIGYLGARSSDADRQLLVAIRQGLSETNYSEGKNLRIEYRWAEGQYSRLSALAADLVSLHVAVIMTGGNAAAPAAKAATTTIPVVFSTGSDPVNDGLVDSLNQPHGNLTGVTTLATQLNAKQLGLLKELVPNATTIALLTNPESPFAKLIINEVSAAALTIGSELLVVKASTERDIDSAFATLVQRKCGGLLVSSDGFLVTRRNQIIALAARHAVPTIYNRREYAADGGLISYGASFEDMYRQVGVYAGRILKGAKPADLPVLQPTKFNLVINLKTAKTLGITIPSGVLAIADEVIE
jgi:putative ABC transport system substrate-binding protein